MLPQYSELVAIRQPGSRFVFNVFLEREEGFANLRASPIVGTAHVVLTCSRAPEKECGIETETHVTRLMIVPHVG